MKCAPKVGFMSDFGGALHYQAAPFLMNDLIFVFEIRIGYFVLFIR